MSIASGLPPQPATENPFANRTLALLRDSLETALVRGGFNIPAGTQAFLAVLSTCKNAAPNCQTAVAAINADTATGAKIDATGKATFPGVAPGSYYVMGTAPVAGHPCFWGVIVNLKPGTNLLSLDQHNSKPLN